MKNAIFKTFGKFSCYCIFNELHIFKMYVIAGQLVKYCILIVSIGCIAAASTASADEWGRPDPYNLICNINGDLGPQRLVFRVKPPRFPLIDSTPRLSLVTDSEQAITVEQVGGTTLRAKMIGPVPGWPDGTSTMAITLNRNTGEIKIKFYPADWQETPRPCGRNP